MRPSIIVFSVSASLASAQVPAWGQCGGQGYTGPTACLTGYTCNYVNDWFWQCQQGMGTVVPPSSSDAGCPASSRSATTFKTTTSPTVTSIVVQPTSDSSTSTTGTSTSDSSTSTTPTSVVVQPTSASSTSISGTSASSRPSSTSATNSPTVQFLGRINPDTKELSWPGTGLRFSYNGNAQIDFTATGTNSGDLIIDGTTTTIPSVTGTIPLPSGNHNVEFRKRSEAGLGSLFAQISGSPAANKLIEFIGDSITVGYGLDGVNPCTNSAQVEDSPKTYAALAANALGADYNVIAWSGKGVLRNIAGDNGPLMPELWTRYGANDADNSYTFPVQAQVVVINLGTNDFGYLGARDAIDVNAYQNAVVNFVTTIQSKYTSVQVFLMSSPMLQDAWPTASDAQHTTMSNALKNAAGSTGAHFVDWPTQGTDVGCDYHPNAATHAAEAPVLASAIRQVMGW